MALVAYDNSDSSEFEDDDENVTSAVLINPVTARSSIPDTSSVLSTSSSIENDEASFEDVNLFNQLPQPSRNKVDAVIEEDDEFLHKKETPANIVKPKAKITVPSLSDFKDVEDSATNYKPRAPSNKKSGLLSMLPQPKNAVLSKTTSKSLIPHVLTKKPPVNTAKQKFSIPTPFEKKPDIQLSIDYSDDSDNEDDTETDFFSINKINEVPDVAPVDMNLIPSKHNEQSAPSQLRGIESYFKKDIVENDIPSSSNGMYEEGYSESNQQEHMVTDDTHDNADNGDIPLDEEAIRQLIGARGKRKREEIQIVDINQQEVLGDAREWLIKGLMDDTTTRASASKKKGNGPTSQQKRKHQITYLAHQAKANEAELQNQWANNRMSKRASQSKYGF